jgi:hypothetical protein
VKDLVTEQRMNCVSTVTGRPASTSRNPQALTQPPSPSRDSQRKTGDLPFLHSFADEGVEIVGESVRHASASSLLRDPAFGRAISRASSTINPFQAARWWRRSGH